MDPEQNTAQRLYFQFMEWARNPPENKMLRVHARTPYTGAELRRLAAERGVGSPAKIDPKLLATFKRSPR